MKRLAIALACAAGLLLPAVARAALTLDVAGPMTGRPAGVDAHPIPGRQAFDLVFGADAASEEDNEGLFAYDLLLTVPEAARGRFRLDGAERPDNFVLDVPSGATFSVAEADANHILINVASNNDLANIRNGMKAARVFFEVTDPTLGVPAPVEVLDFDANSTVFGSGDPNRPLVIEVALIDSAGVVGIPEPTGLTLLAIPALLALRRRPA